MQYSQHAIDSRPRHGVAAVFRPGLAPTLVVLALPAGVGLGCGSSKNDSQPNPDLKVPDVPPGDRGGGGKGGPPGKK